MTAKFICKSRVALVTATLLFTLSRVSLGSPITISSSGLPPTVLGPSSDTLSLNAGSGIYDSEQGPFTFQTGHFVIGNSAIPDQVIDFSFEEAITINGITQNVFFWGQDSVTETADILTIFGGPAIAFGDQMFTLQPFTFSGDNIADYSIGVQASVATTPEPATIVLFGTGLIGAIFLGVRRQYMSRGDTSASV